MKNMKRLIAATAIISVIGASFGGFAMAHGGKGGQGGKMMKGQSAYEQGMRGGKGHGGKGPHGGKGGVPGGIINQQKYFSLLVNTYAADTKADWDAYLKAEKELQTQMDALRSSGTMIDRTKLPQRDQATIDASKAAHDALKAANTALTTAIEKDDAAAIKTALKDLLAAKKQELVVHAKHLAAMKAAQTSSGSSGPASGTSTSALQAL